jgi:hypothetical protein
MRTSILKAVSHYVGILKKQGTLIVPYVFFAVWTLFILISNTYFKSSTSVMDSCVFMVTLFGVLFIVLLYGAAANFSLTESRRRRMVFLCAIGFAAVSLIVTTVLPSSTTRFILTGALAGLGLALFTLIFVIDFLEVEQRARLTIISGILLLSAALFLLAIWLIDSETMVYALLLFLLAAGVLYCRLATPVSSMDTTPVVLSGNPRTVTRSVRVELYALLLVTGFLAGYLLTLFPRTTHYAGILSDSLLGGASAIALLALILCAVILALFTTGFSGGGGGGISLTRVFDCPGTFRGDMYDWSLNGRRFIALHAGNACRGHGALTRAISL